MGSVCYVRKIPNVVQGVVTNPVEAGENPVAIIANPIYNMGAGAVQEDEV